MKYYVAYMRRKGSKNAFRKVKVLSTDLETAIKSIKEVCEIKGKVELWQG